VNWKNPLSLAIYPNPVNDQLLLSAGKSIDFARMSITDASGRLVMEQKCIHSFRWNADYDRCFQHWNLVFILYRSQGSENQRDQVREAIISNSDILKARIRSGFFYLHQE
jgi:hypothetical protein